MSLPEQIPDQSWPALHASGWNLVYETFLGKVRSTVNAVIGALKPVATTGAYTDLTGTPTLGTAAAHAATDFATASAIANMATTSQLGDLVIPATSGTTWPNRAAYIAANRPGYAGRVRWDRSAQPAVTWPVSIIIPDSIVTGDTVRVLVSA